MAKDTQRDLNGKCPVMHVVHNCYTMCNILKYYPKRSDSSYVCFFPCPCQSNLKLSLLIMIGQPHTLVDWSSEPSRPPHTLVIWSSRPLKSFVYTTPLGAMIFSSARVMRSLNI
jgi:hypothetical protein